MKFEKFYVKKHMERTTCALMAAVLMASSAAPVMASPTTVAGWDQKVNADQGAVGDAKDHKDVLESGLSKVQEQKENLETAKKEVTNKVVELDNQMSEVSSKISELDTLMESKQKEIDATNKKLEEAKKDAEAQYENMKIRIRFLYEQGSVTYLQILLASETFSDMLNKAEYIEQLNEYDRDMLKKYADTQKSLDTMRGDLTVQKDALAEQKKQSDDQKKEMQGLISEKQKEIEKYEADIEDKEEAIKEYENMIAQQDATIASLEATVKASIAAREKAYKDQQAALAALAAKNGTTVSGNSAVLQNPVRTYGGGAFAWPAPSYTRISDDYGYRTHPILNVQQFHNGVDMAAPSGTSIVAAADGDVIAAAYSNTMGNYIMIDHGSGLFTIYMHASSLSVSQGSVVKKGQVIGAVGSTGRSTGPHLHFSVRLNGSYVSPWGYL